MPPIPFARRPLIEELEPRLLFSADLAPFLAEGFTPQAEQRIIGGDGEFADASDNQQQAQHARLEVVFIDLRVQGYDKILADIQARNTDGHSIEVVLLDSKRDGVVQIGEFLSQRQDIDAIHLISHGSAGSVQLGSSELNFDSLLANASAIKQWGNALSAVADILIYGCDLASTEEGQSLVDALGSLTGADVAASDDLTGSAALGGDWVLEYRTGAIETPLAVGVSLQQNWAHTLALAVDATSTGTGTGSSITVSHTTSGSERLMLVGISMANPGTDTVSSVTWNGAALIYVGSDEGGSGSNEARVEMWQLVAPQTGTANLVVNFTGAISSGATVGVTTFTGVDQTIPTANFNSSIGSSSTASVSVDSTIDDLVFSAVSFESPVDYNLTLGGSQTERWDLFQTNANGGGSTQAGATSTSVSWDNGGSSNQWALAGVSVRAAVTTANNDTATTPMNTQVIINVAGNDIDPQGDTLTVLDLSKPSHGTATSSGGNITYTPTTGYTGSDSLTYRITDGNEGLTHYWKLDGNGTDSIGSSNGTLNGGPTTTAGRFGDALQFDESNDYVSIPDFTYGTSFTLSFDFNLSDNSGSNYQYIYSHGNVNTANNLNVFLGEASLGSGANLLRTSVMDGNDTAGTYLDVDAVALGLIDGNWHTYTLTVSSTGGAVVYLDGVARVSNASLGMDEVNPSGSAYLGARNNLDAISFYGGKLDSVALYNSALSATEVAARAAGGRLVGTLDLTVAGAAPANTVPGAQTTNEDAARVFSSGNGNQISIADSDAGGANNQITLSVSNGTLTLAGTAGLSFVSGDGTADATMTFRGTASAINTALNGLSYSPTANWNGTDTLTVATKDSVLLSLDIDANLKGRYTFENTGALGTDTSPAAGYAGTPTNASAVVDSTRGNVLSLAGNGYIETTGHFANPTNVTLAAWVNLTSADTAGAEVISLGDSLAIRLDDIYGVTGFYYDGSNWQNIDSNRNLAGTGWHHVAYTFNDTGNAHKLYIDGVEVASATASASISYTLGANSYIGKHGNGSTNVDFNGLIDDARVYSRVLTASEIATLANDLAMTDTDTVAVTANAVNDAPAGTNGVVSAAEDMDYVFAASDFGFTDSDGHSLDRVWFTTLPAQGTLKWNGSAFAAGNFVDAGDIAAGLLTYTPPANASGAAYTSFTFQVQDNGGTANGGVDTDPTANTLTINIAPVNDAPTDIVFDAESTVESTVNTFTTGDQSEPAIAALPNGGYIAVWSSNGQDGSGNGIYGQRFDANGTKVGAEFRVTGETGDSESAPSVSVFADGGFVVAWQDQTSGVFAWTEARVFNADGTAATAEFKVSPGTNGSNEGYQPAVQTLDGNRFVVVWSNEIGATTYEIAGRIYDRAGVLQGSQFTVGALLGGNALFGAQSEVALLNDGGFAVAWRTYDGTNFNSRLRIMNGDGSARSAEIVLQGDHRADVAVLENGNVVAVYGDGTNISARIFNAGGTELVTEFTVNTATTGTQLEPTVTRSDDGFVVAWQSDTGDGSGTGIYAQRFDASGNRIGSEVLVNTTTAGAQTSPEAIESASGQVRLIWASENVDGGGLAVVSRVIATGNASVAENAANGTRVADVLGVFDVDVGDSASYSLTDSAGGRFAIDATTGVVTVANGALLDYETNTSHNITVRVTDGGGLTYDEVLTISVNPVNDAPAGTDKTVTTLEDTAYTFTVADFGFTDPSDSPANSLLAVKISTLPAVGSLTLSGVAVTAGQSISVANITAGNLKFTPAANANGAGYTSFTFQVQDNGGTANGGVDTDPTANTLTVDITPVADLTAADDSFTVAEDTPLTGNVSLNDSTTSGGALTYAVATGVSNGSLSLNVDGSFSYTGNANFHGVDSFSYTVTDAASGESSTQTVSITITPVTDLSAADDSFTVAEDTPLTGNVSLNDSTTSGGALTYAVATGVSNGSLSLNADGSFSYTGNANFHGTDSFSYTVTDAASGESDTRTVSLTITPVNDAPTTSPVTLVAIAEDSGARLITQAELLANATDIDGPGLTATGLTLATGAGSLVNNGDGTWTYTPALNDDTAVSFSYTVTDGSLTAAGTATLDITPVNDAPTASNLNAPETYTEDTPLNLADIVVSDVDSASVTVTLTLSDSAAGSLNTGTSGAVTSTWNAGAGVWTASGAIADVNALLAALTFTPTANYNGNFSIATSVSDGVAAPLTGSKAMTGTAVNDEQVLITNTGATVAENSTGTVITAAMLATSDVDHTAAQLTYTLTAAPLNGTLRLNGAALALSGSFTQADIDAGLLTYDHNGSETASDSFGFSVDDGVGSVSTGTFTIAVTPVNDNAPLITSNGAGANASVSVAENSTAVTTITATDADLPAQTLTYSIAGGADAALFAIDANTGVLTFASGRDRENHTDADLNGVYEVTVQVSDGSLIDTQAITVTVTDVNEFAVTAPVDSNPAANAVDENATNGTVVGITGFASDADATTNTVTYTLFDSAGGRFAIDANTGVVTVANGSLLDREAAASHNITIRATSSDGSVANTSFTININDVDEFDVTNPVDVNAAANTVNENAAIGTVVGITAFATDADATTNGITYSLTDSDGGRFAIDSATGVVTIAGAIDREADGASRSITVRATSTDGSFDEQGFSIGINDVDEFDITPVVDADTAINQINENAAVGTVVGITAFATDADATTNGITYSLDNDAGGRFAIDGSTGVVTVNAALDFESATSHSIVVRAVSADGSFATQGFTVIVADVNESGVTAISDTNGGADFVLENAANGTTVGLTAFADDADGTDSVSYSLDNDAGGRFAIDSATGVVTVAGGIDREAAGNYSITVRATSTDTSTTTQVFNIAIGDVDEFDITPVVDTNATANTVNENAAIGTVVGITAFASDADATTNAITYSLTDSDGGRFAIDSATGVVTIAGAIDREADGASRSITVRATSTDGSFDEQGFSIGINDVDEFDITPVVDTNATANTVNENAAIGTVVGVTAFASDADTTTNAITYSLTSNDGGRFAIDSATGVVTVAGVLDREADGASRSITVRATSTDGSFDEQVFSIGINDVDEFDVAPITDTNAAANAISENAANGSVVDITAFASDADATNNAVTYTLQDNAGGRFAIDSSTGVVTVADGSLLDREAAASHDITVRATSADGSTADTVFTISLNDVDEFDVAPITDADAVVNQVNENAAIGTVVGITAFASDADATTNTVSYSLTDNDGGRFAIDSATGVVTVAAALDFESATSHGIVVRATSTDGSSATQSFTIDIVDANESGITAISDADANADFVLENAANGTAVGLTAFADDADGTDSVSYSLDNDAGGRFAIDSTTGVVTVASGIDREAAGTYGITVRATSTDTSTTTQTFSIVIGDVDEFDVTPVADTNAAANQVDENAANGTVVGITAFASDADATTNTVSYSLDDNAGGRFAIDAATGVVTVADGSLLDRESAASHGIIVRATSADGSSVTQAYTIVLNDMDEFDVAPIVDTDAVVNQVNENAVIGTAVGITAFASDADATTNTISYSLTDNDGGRFAIDSATGVVTVAGAIDREADGATRNVTVRATSTDGSFDEQVFSIGVNDGDEFDVSPMADADTSANLVSENAANGTVAGVTGFASDADATSNAITYSLDDDAGGRFAIDTMTGVVTVADGSLLDYETATSHTVTLRATSSDGSNSTLTLSINVAPVNDNAPVITSDGGGATTTPNVAENTTAVTAVTASDADLPAQTLTYAITGGADAGLFSIDSGTGALRFNLPPDFEAPADSDLDNVYEVIVQVSDGLFSDTQTLAVTVTPANDNAPVSAPVILTPIAEDSGTRLITQAELLAGASDADGDSLTATSLAIGSGGGTLTDNGDGTWTFTPAADDDTSVSFSYTVTDGSLTTPGSATLDIAPANDAPVVAPVDLGNLNEDTLRLITQANLLAGATDADGDTLTATNLALAAGSGVLVDHGDGTWTFTPAANWNGAVSFSFDVVDGTTTVASSASLTVDPVNDAPVISVNTLSLLEGETVVLSSANLNSGDVEQGPAHLTYTVGNVTHGQFEWAAAPGTAIASFTQADIDAGLVVFAHDAGDFAPAYDVTVSDGALTDGPQAATINFTAVAEGINVSPASGPATTEAGGSVSFDVVLDSQPFSDVTIFIASGNPAEGTASLSSLTFTAANWNIAQKVAVTGVDDAVDDGDQSYAIQLQAAVSADRNYDALDPADVALSNLDDDTAGVLVAPASGLVTDESGVSDTFSVVLTSQPLADVVIRFDSSNAAEGVLSNNSLVFTAGDWNIPRTVTATGVSDTLDDGSVAYQALAAPAASADPLYDGLIAGAVDIANLDATDPVPTDLSAARNIEPDAATPQPDPATVPETRDNAAAREAESSSDTGRLLAMPAADVVDSRDNPLDTVLTSRIKTSAPPLMQNEALEREVLTNPDTQGNILLRLLEFIQTRYALGDSGDNAIASAVHVEITQDEAFRVDILSRGAQITAVSLSAGSVLWALRAGGLFTSLLTSLPAWRSFDVLPVLSRDEDEIDDAWGLGDEPEDADADGAKNAKALPA